MKASHFDDAIVAGRFAAIIESTDDAIISKDLNGKITSWNPAAERMFGYKAEEVIGRSITLLFPPGRLSEETKILARLRRGRRVDHFETVRIRKDGRAVDVSATISPIWDSHGKIVGVSKILRDITARKESEALLAMRGLEMLENERALTAAKSALMESEKQILSVSEAERQQIGADLHDNLGQQLTAIELLCQSLREDLKGQPTHAARMAQICRYLQESVAQTRQLARGLTPISPDAGSLADSLAEMARRMSSTRVTCEFTCASPVEISDRSVANHFFRIAQEAVNNAIKHGKADRIRVALFQDGPSLVLTINDDGKGFSMSDLPSPGIGLQIMRHRANVMGASIDIKSSRKGTVVTCTLRGNK
jgi:PAS domain S-box-containing protein